MVAMRTAGLALATWTMVGLASGLMMTPVGSALAAEHVSGNLRFETGPEPAYVVRRALPKQWDPKVPGADDRRWRYWLYDIQSDRRAGRDVVYYEHVYEPKTPSLLGDAGRFQIDFNPEFQTMTLHRVELLRDGQWQNRLKPETISLARRESEFEQDMTNGNVTALIVLDDVRVDDVLRIAYSVSGGNPIMGRQYSDWINLGWRNPVLDSSLRVLYDPGAKFRIFRENIAVEPEVRRDADATEVTVRAHGLAAIVYEDSYPVWYQPYPSVQIALERRWSDVVDWALPLYPRHEGPLGDDLERRLQAWSRLDDPHKRMVAALHAVQNDVRYFGIEIGDNTHRPNPPDVVWGRRYGDCKDKTYLLTTLLQRLGIDAVPALIATDRGRAIEAFVPSASVFDHVIVRARIGNETVWLDPTISQQGGDPRRFDLSDYGMGLPVAKGVTALQPVAPPREANDGVEVVERFVPTADGGTVVFSIETRYNGASADYQRRSTASQRSEELARRYAEYYRKRYGELEVITAPKIEDDPVVNRLVVRESYRLKAPFQTQSSGIRSLEVYAEALQAVSALPSSIDRTGPLGYAAPGRYRHEISVQLPERWKPHFEKETLDRTGAAFGFRREVDYDAKTVKVVYEMDVRKRELPAEQVAAHLQELRKVRDELSANLRFLIPAALDAAQREERLRDLLRNVMKEDKR